MLKKVFPLFIVPLICLASWQREVADWGSIGVMYGGGYLMGEIEPFFANPLIDGPGDKPLLEETVTDGWVYASMLTTVVAASLLPNQDGWFNQRSYRHLKGALQAVTSGYLIKELTKNIVGRPRPDYYDRIDQGVDVVEARKSWPSGHATHFATAATYLTLFTWDEWRSNDAWALAVKGGITTLLAVGTGYVCYTRVADNRHYPGDVIAGALLGAGTSLLCYSYQQWWGKPSSETASESSASCLEISPISLGVRISF